MKLIVLLLACLPLLGQWAEATSKDVIARMVSVGGVGYTVEYQITDSTTGYVPAILHAKMHLSAKITVTSNGSKVGQPIDGYYVFGGCPTDDDPEQYVRRALEKPSDSGSGDIVSVVIGPDDRLRIGPNGKLKKIDSPTFEIKELSKEDQRRLSDAVEAEKAATEARQEIERQIKAEHGEESGATGWTTSTDCLKRWTKVAILGGKYVQIERGEDYICAAMEVLR